METLAATAIGTRHEFTYLPKDMLHETLTRLAGLHAPAFNGSLAFQVNPDPNPNPNPNPNQTCQFPSR